MHLETVKPVLKCNIKATQKILGRIKKYKSYLLQTCILSVNWKAITGLFSLTWSVFFLFDLFSYDYHEFKFLSVQLLSALISMKEARRRLFIFLQSASLPPDKQLKSLLFLCVITYPLRNSSKPFYLLNQFKLLQWADCY